MQAVAQEKSQKRTAEMSRKQLLMNLEPWPVQVQLTPTGNPNDDIQKLTGQYSRLRRELSLAMRPTQSQTVCSVTVIDTADHTSEESESGHQSQGLTNDTDTFENLTSLLRIQ